MELLVSDMVWQNDVLKLAEAFSVVMLASTTQSISSIPVWHGKAARDFGRKLP